MPLEEAADVGVERAGDQVQQHHTAASFDTDRQSIGKQADAPRRSLPGVWQPLGRQRRRHQVEECDLVVLGREPGELGVADDAIEEPYAVDRLPGGDGTTVAALSLPDRAIKRLVLDVIERRAVVKTVAC